MSDITDELLAALEEILSEYIHVETYEGRYDRKEIETVDCVIKARAAIAKARAA